MRLPAVAPALALLAGVASGAWHEAGPGPGALPLLWLLWGAAGVCLTQRASRLFALSALSAFAFCGWTLSAWAARDAAEPPLRTLLSTHLPGTRLADEPTDPLWVTGRLAEDVLPDEEGIRLAVDVESVEIDGGTFPSRGRVLLSVGGEPPASTDAWSQGRRVRVPALLRRPARYLDPGVADGEKALARRGVALVGSVKSPLLVDSAGEGRWRDEAAVWLRAWARGALDRYVGAFDRRSSAVARAVLLGDRTGLDRETTERLQQAGTYHVIAISGGNIAILTALLIFLFRVAQVRSAAADAGIAALLFAYAWFVGGGASVVRATLMAVTYVAARAGDLRTPPVNALAVSAGILLAAAPLSVFDPGAWLTFGATFSILVGVGELLPRLGLRRAWSRSIAGVAVASLSAELGLFPVSVLAFSRFTMAGLVVNFAAVPLMSVVQVGGIATLVAAAVHGGLASWCGMATHLAAWGMVESARLVDVAPWATWRLPPPAWPVLVTYYASWAVVLARRAPRRLQAAAAATAGSWRPGRAARGVAAGLLVLSGAWMLSGPHGGRPRAGRLRVTWIDVGQGDAVLVELPGGTAMLVDAGGASGRSFDIGRRVIEPALWARGVARLDYLALTHADADHVSAAATLTRDFRPVEVWEGIAVAVAELRPQILLAAAGTGASWRTVQRGDALESGGARLTVRHPGLGDWERQRVRNDDSTVIEIRFGDVSVILPGDIEATAEAEVAASLEAAPLRVVEAPHHGSATSSTEVWLDAVRADAAVVSAGRGNRYGHPHAAVLARLRARGIPVFRTDRDGAVTLETDGRSVWLRSVSGRQWRADPPAGLPAR